MFERSAELPKLAELRDVLFREMRQPLVSRLGDSKTEKT